MGEQLVGPLKYLDLGDVRCFFFAERPELPPQPSYDLTLVDNQPYFVYGEAVAIPASALLFSDRVEKVISLAADSEDESMKLTEFGILKINEEILRKIESFCEVCDLMQNRNPEMKTATIREDVAVEESEEDKIRKAMSATRRPGLA
jgi:hypothetical protein